MSTRRRRSLLNSRSPLTSRNPVRNAPDSVGAVELATQASQSVLPRTPELTAPRSVALLPSTPPYAEVRATVHEDEATVVAPVAPGVPEQPAPSTRTSAGPSGLLVVTRMGVAFVAAAVLSYLLVAVPWMLVLSPALHRQHHR